MKSKSKPHRKAKATLTTPGLPPVLESAPVIQAPTVAPSAPQDSAMQVDAPPAPQGLLPPHNDGLLPPFEIPCNYGVISQAFLATHPIHLTLRKADTGDAQALIAWYVAGVASGIASSYLGDFLEEYRVQVELLSMP